MEVNLVPPLDDADRALLAGWGIHSEVGWDERARRIVLVGRLQRQLNYDLGEKLKVDGLWGPQSQALYEEWMRRVPYPVLNADVQPIVMEWMAEHGKTRPPPGEWPHDDRRDRRVLAESSARRSCPYCGGSVHVGLCGGGGR